MRVFLAGATGALGRRLLPRLIQRGDRVMAMTRREDRLPELGVQGAEPLLCDAFDERRLHRALAEFGPEAVVHQLTRIPPRLQPRRIDAELAATNRLRTEGTRILVDGARRAGARLVIAQSIAFAYAPTRGPAGAALAGEEEPLYLDAPESFASLIHAAAELERTVLGEPAIEGVVLRYGFFYGPGTHYAPDGGFARDVLRRRVPVVGAGEGVFSFIHLDDAARATVRALDGAAPGLYNVVDDEPTPFGEWLPGYAKLLGAKPPFRVPKLLGRLAGGAYGIYLLTELRGASNRKIAGALGWRPEYRSWRDGFRADLAAAGGG